ncbi:MAG: molybdenum cofactor guanylyltransferase [Pirellulales bacterium]|nr:molybdenum cofactor guanylyltransferase [Pirellulales bacterium]
MRGAIVLCGGKSSRMGYPKAMLPFGQERMLQRVVRLVSTVVTPEHIVVVAAPRQELPPLPREVTVAHDRREGRGPLEGLAAGLATLGKRVDAAYATSCDVPLLLPQLVVQMFELLGDYDVAVPQDEKFHHPLAACYRVSVLQQVENLLAADRLRPQFLFDEVNTRKVPVEALRTVDAELASLRNLNTPDDYFQALELAGLPVMPGLGSDQTT